MRNNVIKIVEKIYTWALMSVKFWWINIKNWIIYGLVNAMYACMLYFLSNEKDLHQKLNDDTHITLKKASLMSAVSTILMVCSISAAYLMKKVNFSLTHIYILYP